MVRVPSWLKIVWILLFIYILAVFYLFWTWGFMVVRPF
jgi:hypothetical protein